MGGLILVLLMTGIVCGGVPLLAFAYIMTTEQWPIFA